MSARVCISSTLALALLAALAASARRSHAEIEHPAVSTSTPDRAATGQALQPEPVPVSLGVLKARNFAVHLYTGNLYAVEDASGEFVSDYLTEAEFADAFPEIYAQAAELLAADPIADNLQPGFDIPLTGRSRQVPGQ